MSQVVLDKLKERFKDAILETHNSFGNETALVSRESLLDVMRFLKDECGFEMLMDLCGVDHLPEVPRFEVVYHLKSFSRGYRVRIKVRVPEEDPVVDSVISVWKGANWYERECWEFYGIKFRGHPDLRRLLLYPEFEGYPLRKDYPHKKRQPRIPLLKPETR
jgi:NADH-quinone oxidoreductase subunit C